MEATSTAKEALALLPLCARAVCLAGVVMKENSTLHNKVFYGNSLVYESNKTIGARVF